MACGVVSLLIERARTFDRRAALRRAFRHMGTAFFYTAAELVDLVLTTLSTSLRLLTSSIWMVRDCCAQLRTTFALMLPSCGCP